MIVYLNYIPEHGLSVFRSPVELSDLTLVPHFLFIIKNE